MQRMKEVTKLVKEVEAYICNKCGKETPSNAYGGALISAFVSGGYESKFMEDGAAYNFDLCEECVVELMKTFKHSAFISCTFCDDSHHLSENNLHVCSHNED